MWMAAANTSDLAQPPEGAPPVAGQRVLRSDASPKPIPLTLARAGIERRDHEWWERCVHRHGGLRRVQEQAVALQPIHRTACGAADAQRGVPQEEDGRPQSPCVLLVGLAVPIRELLAGGQERGDLFAGVRHRRRASYARALELE